MQPYRLRVTLAVVLAFTVSLSDRVAAQEDPFIVKRDLIYSKIGERELPLDLYLPTDAKSPVPVVMWIHGGGWRTGRKGNGGAARMLVEAGYAVVDVEYRLTGEAIFPAQVQDCKAAVRWIRANAKQYNLDPHHIGVWGSSAGGHLSALLGASGDVADFETESNAEYSSRVQAVCDWYGPTDLLQMNAQAIQGATLNHDSVNSPESQLVGGAIQDEPFKSIAVKANPITYVSKDDPPFLIMHGDQDLLVSYRQSEILHAALQQAGVSSTLRIVKGEGHGFRDRATRDDLIKQATAFFDKHLKLATQAKAASAEIPDAKIRNVLFIISDDLKASVLGCYGDEVCHTPHIDRLAKTGVVFNRAYCQGTWCLPSRKSFMFSKYEGAGEVNMGEHFKENGWYSARVGKIYHMRVPGDIIDGTNGEDVASSWTERFNSPGMEAHTPGEYACLNQNIFTTDLEGRQSTKMPHRMFVTVQYKGDGSDQPDHKSATKAIELMRTHRDKPFFLAVGLVRPHYPMVAPQQYFDPYPWAKMSLPHTPENDLADIPAKGLAGTRNNNNSIGKYPDNQKRMWAGYYASVTFMDDQVGRILAELDRLDLRDSTAIVFTSDHGYHLGEHGFWQKSNLHEEVTRVPMVIAAPGFAAGRTDSMVELVDLYPTLSELAGLKIPAGLEGVSLVPILKDSTAAVKEGALSLNKGGVAVRTIDWAYMRYSDGSKELYDMKQDPHQFTNLADEPSHAATIQRLDEMITARRKK